METTNETPTKGITIQGLTFQVPSPYAEGHQLTANEAAVLNQTLAENLRNNFASTVADAHKKAEADKSEVDSAALQEALNKYIESYTFGVRRGGGITADPIQREARETARDIAKNLLKKKGHKLVDVEPELMNSMIDEILKRKPEILENAKKVVEQRNAVAASSDLGLEDL